jgi:hypothetical protein
MINGNSLLLLRRTCSSHLSVLVRSSMSELAIWHSLRIITDEKGDSQDLDSSGEFRPAESSMPPGARCRRRRC